MDTITQVRPIDQEPTVVPKRSRSVQRLAFACFAIGFLTPLLGFAFVLIHAAVVDDAAFGRWGTALMFATIPLLMLASHLMDLSEKRNK